MKEIVDQKKKKKNGGGKMEKKKKKLTGTVEETIVLKTGSDRQVQLVQPWTSIYTGSVIKKKNQKYEKNRKNL